MTLPGSGQGSWICYSTQGGPQGYAATSRMSSALSGEATALFIRHAQESLAHVPQAGPPLWQYVGSADQGPAVLTRATTRTGADGTPSAVIWGLVLPPQHLASPRFALQACVGLFPGESNAPWPQAVDLASLAPPAANEGAQRLAAAYAEAGGRLRLPPPAEESPVVLLCQVLELLPPGDRRPMSFATAPLGLRRIELDPSVTKTPQPSAPALARLKLWDRLRRVLDTAEPATSLRQDPQAWVSMLLMQPDVPGRVIALLRLLGGEEQASELWQTVITGLRRALEQAINEQEDPLKACHILEELCRAGLLARHDLFPPLWAARIALKLQVLGRLSPQTLAQILRPDPAQLLQLLVTGLRRGPVIEKTVDLVAGLARTPAPVNRQLFRAASQETLSQLCQPARLQNDAELATAVAVLAMYFHGKTEAAP